MDEDEEIEIRSSRKRKTVTIESSSDDEDANITESETPEGACQESSSASARSSARIAKRRSRSFEMPTREKVWKTITPSKSSAGKIHQLAPRKLVNNFTKENNRYNYDPNYTSGEESMEDFLVDDLDEDPVSESSSSSVDRKPKKTLPKRRLKNHRERLIVETSSDTDSEVGKSRSTTRNGDKRRSVALESSTDQSDDEIQDCHKKTENRDEPALSVGESSGRHSHCESGFEDCGNGNVAEDDDTDDDVLVSPCGKRRKSNVINSDESEPDESKNTEHLEENKGESVDFNKDSAHEEQQECDIIKDDSESSSNVKESSENPKSDANKSDANDKLYNVVPGASVKADGEETENDANKQSGDITETVREDGDDSESSSDEESEESDEESDSEIEDIVAHNERARVQMLKKKKAKLKLFERFREERKRKLSKGDKSG